MLRWLKTIRILNITNKQRKIYERQKKKIKKIENFLLYIIFKLSLTRTKNLGEGRGMGAVKDSNGDDNENDSNKLTFTAVLSVSDKSQFACTVVRALSVVTNGIYMTTMQAFLTFVDIYGYPYVNLMLFLHVICSA